MSTRWRQALKRALWCRWFHRWRDQDSGTPVVIRSSAGNRRMFAMPGGPARKLCSACMGRDYGRAYARWLGSA